MDNSLVDSHKSMAEWPIQSGVATQGGRAYPVFPTAPILSWLYQFVPKYERHSGASGTFRGKSLRKSASSVRNTTQRLPAGGFNLVSHRRWPRMRAACKTMLPHQSFWKRNA